MEIHFLKTTWSDIIILKNGEEVAMIDTGFQSQFDQIKEYLNELNIKHISFILLTHFHRDHYGCIPDIIKNYHVDKVYFKNYSGLDKTTATGTEADDAYRAEEARKCREMKETIAKYSTLIEVENLKSIFFGNYELKLFSAENSMREIYEDDANIETYHKYLYNENQNSLAAFMKVNGVNIFFGGDIFDGEKSHPKSNYVNYQIAQAINESIDIYKVPHHGTNHCNSKNAINIYRPKLAIITNSEDYLKNESTILTDLKEANRDIKILLTENCNIVVNISASGEVSYKEC